MTRSGSFHLPPLMGHRGAAALAPENTLAGLSAARKAGCSWIEVDVMLSRDGVPVLHHDHSLQRTAGLKRRLEKLDAAELGIIDVGSGFGPAFAGERIPTLAQSIDWLKSHELGLNLEIKPAPGWERATAAAAIEVLRAHWPDAGERLMLSSFRGACLMEARRLAPEIPRALIAHRAPQHWRGLLDELDCVSLHLSRSHLTAARAGVIREAGYGLAIYTVNDAVEAETFRRWGANCIITDSPDVVRAPA